MANVSEQDRTIHRPALRDSGGHPLSGATADGLAAYERAAHHLPGRWGFSPAALVIARLLPCSAKACAIFNATPNVSA